MSALFLQDANVLSYLHDLAKILDTNYTTNRLRPYVNLEFTNLTIKNAQLVTIIKDMAPMWMPVELDLRGQEELP